ncbi:hypothetical protein LCGC14_2100460 [marine sediment metagenome]|uniref:DNA-directed DNA polymerase family A palm domain-containing protein n=1 Tax=marine sediment metagenome TaxID=412755 RepID=A0A0F9EA08_9ZZZZ
MKHQYVTTSHAWLNIPDDVLGRYNFYDTLATARLSKVMPTVMRDNGTLAYWNAEVWPLVPAAIAMAQRGLPIDLEARQVYGDKLRVTLKECDEVVRKNAAEFGHATASSMNLNSPTQVADLLYNTLKFKVLKRTEGDDPSVDQEALTRLLRKLLVREQKYLPLLHALFHRSRLQTIDERYLDFDTTDGRVYPTVKMYSAKTGRYAYEHPPVQQWVPEIKHLVAASSGDVLISGDYSALEARIFSYLAGDSEIFEFMNQAMTSTGIPYKIYLEKGPGTFVSLIDSSPKTSASEP